VQNITCVYITCVQCDLRLLFASNFASQCVIIMENCTNSEMTDMVLCYGSANGVALRAQALYRERFPARRVPHSQTFLAVVYGKMVLFDREVWRGAKSLRHEC
jgi:hypothetical protein